MRTNAVKSGNSVSQIKWVVISGLAFLVSLAAAAILIFYGARLNDLGFSDKIYYLILIPLGLSAAAFLAGAMKSYASYKSSNTSLYGTLALGGPVVIFALVVGGGFYIPRLNEKAGSFDLKVRISSPDRETSSFDTGTMKLYLGN